MTLDQLQTYIVGVLQGYLPNKAVLDKLSEDTDGTLLFNGEKIIGGETVVTDTELQQAITDTLEKLGVTDIEEITASVASFAALQTAIANGANVITVTSPLNVTSDVTLESEEPIKIIADSIVDAFTVKDGTLTLGKNIKVTSDTSILYATDDGIITIDGAELYCKGETTLGYADKNSTINVNSGSLIANDTSTLCVSDTGAEINISGGTIQTKATAFAAAYAKNGGTLNITDGTITNNGSAGDSYTVIAATDGIVNISGGSVDNGVLAHESANAKATISGTANITGTVGTKDDAILVITGGTFKADPSEYVADGYTVLNMNDSYSVIKNV